MRIVLIAIFAILVMLVVGHSYAQTYDPRYPICMKVYIGDDSGGEWIDCSYISLPQCKASASGRSAMCEVNPYFAQKQLPGRELRRRY